MFVLRHSDFFGHSNFVIRHSFLVPFDLAARQRPMQLRHAGGGGFVAAHDL
ncbi:MAG TPA: hypothetical protein VHZ24_22770 [Pirellulales bacterium]|nr:hypothetical protein [Pirellulales bacterium]